MNGTVAIYPRVDNGVVWFVMAWVGGDFAASVEAAWDRRTDSGVKPLDFFSSRRQFGEHVAALTGKLSDLVGTPIDADRIPQWTPAIAVAIYQAVQLAEVVDRIDAEWRAER